MPTRGEMFVAGEALARPGKGVRAIDAATGAAFGPSFGSATREDLDGACAAAAAAVDPFRQAPSESRARLLDAIAAKVDILGDELLDLCAVETGLPRARLEIERVRTVRQLRMFAEIVRVGDYLGARIDPSQPDRVPPRVDLRMRYIPLGPVAVFGASNFPLAFSVAGGDTASALAAGAPVIAKAHPAHPGTSELVGRAVTEAVAESGLPAGIFSMIFDAGYDIGQALVADPRISAVAFTGSRRGGLALIDIARKRSVPIPVYAEMSSINPVILFEGALDERADAIAREFIGSLTVGAGQLCTNAGIVLAVEGPGLERFLQTCAMLLSLTPAGTMLTPAIHDAYVASVRQVERHPAVVTISRGLEGSFAQGRAGLFSTSPQAFLSYHELQAEIFGAAALVVRCPDRDALRSVVEALEGQLTASIHIAAGDHRMAADIIPLLERKAGRIVVNGFATGVEVGHAMVHGGPYPSTSDSRSTSVGSLAIARFLRPVCYQDMPDDLLPDALKNANPLGLRRKFDGRFAT